MLHHPHRTEQAFRSQAHPTRTFRPSPQGVRLGGEEACGLLPRLLLLLPRYLQPHTPPLNPNYTL